jgi:mRNA interferase RelE/StbE
LKYRIDIRRKAEKFIRKLPWQDKERVLSAIYRLPEGEDIKKLQGHEGLMRLRVGDYRIIYRMDNGRLIVLVIDAGSRGDIYKRY